jgi:hypothetical protein
VNGHELRAMAKAHFLQGSRRGVGRSLSSSGGHPGGDCVGDQAIVPVRCAWRRAGRDCPRGAHLTPALARLHLSVRGSAPATDETALHSRMQQCAALAAVPRGRSAWRPALAGRRPAPARPSAEKQVLGPIAQSAWRPTTPPAAQLATSVTLAWPRSRPALVSPRVRTLRLRGPCVPKENPGRRNGETYRAAVAQ